ncbi:FtsX-like permease family protein [Nonomuraea sp. NPDC047897]|uniref:FtsX-like permease family protein n=1 Tax=Nonomuraea sp. NPDC047897 TaxID=3364346 RepID=UPI00371ED0C6
MSAFRAALRIARRDALRFRGRTALIMVMIGLPVLVFTAAFTGYATMQVSPREGITAALGQADAHLVTVPGRVVRQDPSGRGYQTEGAQEKPHVTWTAEKAGALLGGRLIPYHTGYLEVRLPDGYSDVPAIELDLRDPMTRGVRALSEGRLPTAPGEVAVSPAMADRGAKVGTTIKLTERDAPFRVVGVVEHPQQPASREVVSFPGGLANARDQLAPGWLADTPSPVLWNDVRRLNEAGILVVSRAVIEDPPQRFWAEERPLDREAPLWIAIAVVLIVMETVLLAGPAFAVGLRRRRRELAVIAAHGASAGHLRTIVLADGLVLGGAAALLGAALGVAAGWAGAAVLDQWYGSLGPLEVAWWQTLAIATLGLISGLVAAVVPAVQAARQSAAEILAGRGGQVRDRAGRPLLGLVLVVAGLAATVHALRGTELAIVAASVLVVFGLVALMPWLVRFLGRAAPSLPLPMRLSVRDAGRHRGRTASAAAAVMAATMAAVAVSVGVTSNAAEEEARYSARGPIGSATITGSELDDREWAAARAAVRERLPGAPVVASHVPAQDEGAHGVWDTVCGRGSEPNVLIGGADLLAFQQGRTDPAAAAALSAGKAVVFDPAMLCGGTLVLDLVTYGKGEKEQHQELRIPAVPAQGAEPRQRGAVVPLSALTRLGVRTAERRLHVMHRPADLMQFRSELRGVNRGVWAELEQGYHNDARSLHMAAFALAAVLALGGTFAATGLAAADMRRDLDTLSAVGAAPRTRRLVVATQAGFIAATGTLVGLVAGLVTGIALTWPMTRHGAAGGGSVLDPGPTVVAVPWLPVAVGVVGLPILAALVAGLVTRTRLVVARRLA